MSANTDPSGAGDRRGIDPGLAQTLHDTAAAVADAARAAILPHFRRMGLEVASKGAAFDPVTEADTAAEAAMRGVIGRMRPGDGIHGEEMGLTEGTTGLRWVIDPIDGTRGFLSGTPTWGVLVAVSDENGPLLGIIDQPYIGERFTGGLGVARLDGPGGSRPLATRAPRPLSEAILFTTFPEVGTSAEGAAFRRVSEAARLTRYGTDCYAYALVALGQVDLVIEAGLHPFDIAGPLAVVEAAGGVVTDWQGGPAYEGGQVVAAANPEVHREALRRLSAG